MDFIATKLLSNSQKAELVQLWNTEYPAQLKHESRTSFELYLETLSQKRHILLCIEHKILGWYSDFYRDNQKWFLMILDITVQRKGYGTKLLNQAKNGETELNGWVIDHNEDIKQNGEPYSSPLGFYLKNGFKVIPDIRSEDSLISTVKINWKKQ